MKSQNHSKLTVLALMIFSLVAVVAFADDQEGSKNGLKTETAAAVSAEKAESPMKAEINSALEIGNKLIADIRQSLRNSSGPAQSKSLQAELERAKSEVELSILQIQFKYAQTEGRSDHAKLLDTAIESLKKQNERAIAETSQQ